MPWLKNGTQVADRRLGRLTQFDERSRSFPIRAALPDKPPRSYTWAPPAPLDQGREGSCVGHAWAHEIGAKPAVSAIDSALAVGLYRRAQQLDPWPGQSPDYEGTSVLAGIQAAKERGFYDEYRWVFGGVSEMVMAIGYGGPGVIGVAWYEGMFRPDSNGYINPTGSVAGGHAICVYGVSVRYRYFKLLNSWGPGWGRNGTCLVSFDSMERLLAEDGECCVPTRRLRP